MNEDDLSLQTLSTGDCSHWSAGLLRHVTYADPDRPEASETFHEWLTGSDDITFACDRSGYKLRVDWGNQSNKYYSSRRSIFNVNHVRGRRIRTTGC